jgi:hypothetical protein
MGFKETFEKEKRDLSNVKRAYESVSFLLLTLLVVQQLFYWGKNLIDFLDANNTWFSTANIITQGNLQGFVVRIIGIDSSKWLWVILGLVAYLGYWFLMYLLVWSYCKKQNLAKWTWTLFVAFGPTIFFAPPYIWFAIYAFRPYIARFMKRAYEEFKSFDPNTEFEEEKAEVFDETAYDQYIKDEPVYEEPEQEVEQEVEEKKEE